MGGYGLILPGALLQMVLLVPSVVRGTERRIQPPGAAAAAHFLHQVKDECHFANGTAGEVWFLRRDFYGRQEIDRFDSRRGWFEAVTELGAPDVRLWNSQKDYLDYMRAAVDSVCRNNYEIDEHFLTTWKVEPTVRISHTKADRLARQSLLICTAAGYYPSEINIKWLKNGQEQTEGLGYSEKFQNGDWTFQDQVMLETVPEWGDVYACQVEHSSTKEPITVQWEPRSSSSAKGKVGTGATVAVLGVVFGAVGVALFLRTRPAAPTAPAAGLIS